MTEEADGRRGQTRDETKRAKYRAWQTLLEFDEAAEAAATAAGLEDPTELSNWFVSGWEYPPYEAIDISQSYDLLRERVEEGRDPEKFNMEPWYRCLTVAESNGAKTAVLERRYVDPDYTAEYATFYSTISAPIPDTTIRIHFFTEPFDKEDLEHNRADISNLTYLGFVVCRPSGLEMVGRTVLVPPPGQTVHSAVRVPVNFFGRALDAIGMPFMQQDARVAVCAHACIWMIGQVAAAKGFVGHQTIVDVTRVHGDTFWDAVPGMTPMEARRGVIGMGLSAFSYNLQNVDWEFPPPLGTSWRPGDTRHEDNRDYVDAVRAWVEHQETIALDSYKEYTEKKIAAVVAPILNSTFPVYVAGAGHAFIICGYDLKDRVAADTGEALVKYSIHDDQRGPYLVVDDPLSDDLPWEDFLAPAPPSTFLAPNDAEFDACFRFQHLRGRVLGRSIEPDVDTVEPDVDTVEPDVDTVEPDVDTVEPYVDTVEIARRIGSDGLDEYSIRSYFLDANVYRQQARERSFPERVAVEIERARMARYVLVVELIDPDEDLAERRVIGEIVYDASSSQNLPLTHVEYLAGFLDVRDATARHVTVNNVMNFAPHPSGRPVKERRNGDKGAGAVIDTIVDLRNARPTSPTVDLTEDQPSADGPDVI